MREEDARAAADFRVNKAREEAEAEAEAEKQNMIVEMYEDGMNIAKIAKFTQKTEEEVQQIIAKHKE